MDFNIESGLTQMVMVRCSPTEFTEYTEFGSVGMAGMPYPPTSVNIRAHLWGTLLCQKVLCVPCVLWENTAAWLVQQRLLHPLLNDYGRN